MARWAIGVQVGDYKPTCIVQIQEGRYKRGYRPWAGSDVSATIPGESKNRPWMAYWQASGPWTTVPGVKSIQISSGFDQGGMPVANVVINNVRFAQRTGHAVTPPGGSPLDGIYYAIERGYLSPLRGYRAPQRPASAPANEWARKLKRARRIRTWQGYGPPNNANLDLTTNGGWSFHGMIDDVTPTGDEISLTARMGTTLTDQRTFGWNKSRQLSDPVIFCDREDAEKIKRVGSSAKASSTQSGHPAKRVLDEDSGSSWRSAGNAQPEVTQWIEIRVPKGRYTDFVMDPAYDGLEMYVGFYVRDGKVDGVPVSNGWVGSDTVPGGNGGWKYIRKAIVSTNRTQRTLGHSIECGDNSILRIGFRNLQKRGGQPYRAGVTYLRAIRRTLSDEAERDKYILVDDITDVVKIVLRWAGFTEWSIESAGVRLNGKAVFNRSTMLSEIIAKAAEQTGWLFHVVPPVTGESQGIAIFTSNQALVRSGTTLDIRDDQLLTAIQPRFSRDDLPYIVRVRGKEHKNGAQLGADKSKRIMAVLWTPWGDPGTGDDDLAGVIRHSVVSRPDLGSYEECVVAAYLVCINAALQQVTATAEIPANPMATLNFQVGLIDKATGINSRLWISNWTHEASYTQEGYWRMSLGGSLIDTPDMQKLLTMIESKGLMGRLSPIGRI